MVVGGAEQLGRVGWLVKAGGILAPEPHVQDVHVTNPATVVRSDKMHRALDNSHSFIGRVLAVTAKLYASQRSVRRPDQPIQSPASRSRSRAVPASGSTRTARDNGSPLPRACLEWSGKVDDAAQVERCKALALQLARTVKFDPVLAVLVAHHNERGAIADPVR
jgi:hypothetical protein